jgi:4'-phosphopantetheinyl transferase EntD
MDHQKFFRTFRGMLPPCICLTAGPPVNDATPLTARESASAGPVDINRLRELESGRAYAKRALAMLGVHNAELAIGPNRAPLWPTGVVGSLTHVLDRSGGYFAAAVARTDAVLAVGIDIERENALHPDIWPYVLTKRELQHILAVPADIRRAEALFLWCAKEATVKFMQQPIDPSEIAIERDPKNGRFVAIVTNGHATRSQPRLLGHTAYSQGLFLATAFLLR